MGLVSIRDPSKARMIAAPSLRCTRNREDIASNVGHHHSRQPELLANTGLVDDVAADDSCSDSVQLVVPGSGDFTKFVQP